MTQTIAVLNTPVRMHEGLYSLNDLHKASGAEEETSPDLLPAHRSDQGAD